MNKLEGSRWKVLLAARILLVLGLVNIGSSVSKPFHNRLHLIESVLPKGLPDLATAASIIVGVLLIVLSFAVARRNHLAHLITEILLIVSAGLEIAKGLYIAPALAALSLATFLFLIRREFYAKPVRKVITRAAIIFGQFSLLSFTIGLVLLFAPDRLFNGEVSLVHMAQTVIRSLVGLSGPSYFVSHREQDVFDYAMAGLGLLTVVSPLLALLQPSPPKPHMSDADELALRILLQEFGERDSVGYFALREDKSIIWSNSRKSAITYRVVGGCALASGDPIGNPDTWPQVMHEFIELSQRNGWTPGVVGCSEEAGEIWVRETDMIALEIGDEAVVNVSEYEPDNPRYRNVRQSVRRILKQDYITHVYRSCDMNPQMRAELTQDSKKWRDGATERGFMMGLGRIAEINEPDLLIVTASKDGQLRGILQYVPWGEKALSLDLMRRAPHADSGINELMIDATINYARENGFLDTSSLERTLTCQNLVLPHSEQRPSLAHAQ